MNKKSGSQIVVVIIAIVAVIVVAGIYGTFLSADSTSDVTEYVQLVNEAVTVDDDTSTKHLEDNYTLYEYDETDVVCMYLTVRKGNEAENTNHTWEQINKYSVYDYDDMNVDRYKVEALLQVGNEYGPLQGELGYGRTASNATVQIRGQTSSRYDQKNYKIKLDENAGLWHDQQTIALNKHRGEGLRFRNMLGYSILEDIDELMSLRTQLVHLYVKDETSEAGTDAVFEDYGLYTQIEQLNKRAMTAHGLDKNGQLYKINFFEFFRYEDVIKLVDDPDFDLDEFEDYIEIKGDDDNTKLIEMLEDLNNMSIDIETVIDKHFDMENIAYWMAFEILTGNIDTQSRNLYIYSPQNVDTWYLICWDNDDFFQYYEDQIRGYIEYGGWGRGVSNYWGNVLFQRCLKSEKFRTELDNAINDLRESALSEEVLTEKVTKYREIVKPYVYAEPDVTYAPLTSEQYDEVADNLPTLVDVYYQNYLETLQAPLPFYIGEPTVSDGKITIIWDISYDFQQQDITYHLQLATDPFMQEIIATYDGEWPTYETELPELGKTYYVKVTSEDTDGNVTTAFDYYVDEVDSKYYGVKEFYVGGDGQVYEYEKEE